MDFACSLVLLIALFYCLPWGLCAMDWCQFAFASQRKRGRSKKAAKDESADGGDVADSSTTSKDEAPAVVSWYGKKCSTFTLQAVRL